jgi:PIN domain nuclease of toxin-antitoxin system
MTSLLPDSRALLWFLWDDPQLSGTARTLIEDAGNRKRVRIASCWEIAIKVGLGKLDLAESITVHGPGTGSIFPRLSR